MRDSKLDCCDCESGEPCKRTVTQVVKGLEDLDEIIVLSVPEKIIATLIIVFGIITTGVGIYTSFNWLVSWVERL